MSETSSSQKRTNESSSLSSLPKRAKPASAAFAIGNVSKYFVLATSKIQLIMPDSEYKGENTDWKTLSCMGVVCKDWNREMNLVSYSTIIRTCSSYSPLSTARIINNKQRTGPPTDAALIAQIKSTLGGPRLIDLTGML